MNLASPPESQLIDQSTLGPVVFVGGGNMASAVIGGLLSQGLLASQMNVVDPSDVQRRDVFERFGVRGFSHPSEPACYDSITSCKQLILSVKPQHLLHVLRDLTDCCFSSAVEIESTKHLPLIISLVAGVRSGDLKQKLWPRLVRAMPNTPALVGSGVTALFGGSELSYQDRIVSDALLSSVGRTLWVEKESELDAITAVSGSGPGYIFFFMEAIINAAVDLGISPEKAKFLVINTFQGSSHLISTLQKDPSVLRQQVTSSGGTTQAAIEILESAHLKELVQDALRSAFLRSRELGDEFSDAAKNF